MRSFQNQTRHDTFMVLAPCQSAWHFREIMPEAALWWVSGASDAATCSLCQAGTYGTGSGQAHLHAKMRGAADAGTWYAADAHPAALPARLWAVGWVGAGKGPDAMDSSCTFSEFRGHAGAANSTSCSLCRAGTYLTGSGLHRRWEGVLKCSSVWRVMRSFRH